MLTVEFRYLDAPKGEHMGSHNTHTITLGIYDTIEEAVNEGNKALEVLAKTFEVRPEDKFKVRGLFGHPNRLVTNCCYPTRNISYFAKITKLKFDGLSQTIDKVFEARKRYVEHKMAEADD